MNDLFEVLIYFIIKALVITIIVEMIVLLLIREHQYRIYLISIFINIFTNISLNIMIQFINPKYYYFIVFGLEVMIILIESFGYHLVYRNYKRALIVSLLCNLASFLVGLLLI